MSKDDLPSIRSAKDVASLFKKAGLSGASYREFTRKELKSLPPEESAPRVPVSTAVQDESDSRAVSVKPESGKAAKQSWRSLERVFSGEKSDLILLPDEHTALKVAFLSFAGGAGKTTLATALARLLSAHHRQVLIADCAICPTVLHYFGPKMQRLGPVHFFFPPEGTDGLPVGILRLGLSELQSLEFVNLVRQVESDEGIIFFDLPTVQTELSSEMLSYFDYIVVPLTPTLHSVSSLPIVRQLCEKAYISDYSSRVRYVLNQFDSSRALHCEIRERLEQTLGQALLPTVVSYESRCEEALARGLTIVDYCPESAILKDLRSMAEWVESCRQAAVHTRSGMSV